MDKRFNIRVYGICIQGGRLLVNEEHFRDRVVYKLPGGGLDWGEGTHDCLKREWKEELGVDIEVLEHFYTTHFFQDSAFDSSQVISVYYRVSATLPEVIVNHVPNERTYWMDMADVSADAFTLAIDKVVGGMLQEWHKAGIQAERPMP
jgi:ADP-ribose pyrophosphatase YjhB (NUDIX family)